MILTADTFLARLLRLVSREAEVPADAEETDYLRAPNALQYPLCERSLRFLRMARESAA